MAKIHVEHFLNAVFLQLKPLELSFQSTHESFLSNWPYVFYIWCVFSRFPGQPARGGQGGGAGGSGGGAGNQYAEEEDDLYS